MELPKPTSAILNDKRHERLAQIMGPTASHELIFERDSRDDRPDEFVINVLPRQEDALPLTHKDVLPATPIGTEWRAGLGLSSYYSIPFAAQNRFWVCIGLEHIVPHPTRGYYPVSRGYIYPFRIGNNATGANSKLVQALREMVNSLQGNSPPFEEQLPSHGGEIPRLTEDQPGLDAAMVEKAISHYARGDLFFLRTLLLAVSLHPRQVRDALLLSAPFDKQFGDSRYYLVGTARTTRSAARDADESKPSVSRSQDSLSIVRDNLDTLSNLKLPKLPGRPGTRRGRRIVDHSGWSESVSSREPFRQPEPGNTPVNREAADHPERTESNPSSESSYPPESEPPTRGETIGFERPSERIGYTERRDQRRRGCGTVPLSLSIVMANLILANLRTMLTNLRATSSNSLVALLTLVVLLKRLLGSR